MHSKTPPEVLSPSEMAYISGLNERDRRLFLATRAESLRSQGLSYRKFSKKMGEVKQHNRSTKAAIKMCLVIFILSGIIYLIDKYKGVHYIYLFIQVDI